MVVPSTTVAFVTKSPSSINAPNHVAINRQADTSLNALPPLIIGPMLKKMKEEKAKKNAPMATESDSKGQAPGLRVGGSTWKWPPVWPYDQNFFTPPEDIPKGGPQGNPMAQMMTGGPAPPTPQLIEVEKLDVVQYWQVEQAGVRTEMDEEAAERLTK